MIGVLALFEHANVAGTVCSLTRQPTAMGR